MRGLMMDSQLTVPAILGRFEALSGDVEVVSRTAGAGVQRYRYRDMVVRVKQLAVLLKMLGVRSGDRVGTLAWNHHRHAEAYFAVPSIGGVLHILNLRLHADELAYVVEHAGDGVIIVDASLLPLLEQVHHRVKVEHVIVIGEGELPSGALAYESALNDARADAFTYPEPDERDAAAMCYSSGTTGRPKTAVFSHRALVLLSMIWATVDCAALSRRDSVLAVVPMFHINAWCLPFAAALAGARLFLPESQVQPAALLEVIQTEKVSLSVEVPTI